MSKRLELTWPFKDRLLLGVDENKKAVWGSKEDIETRLLIQLKAVGSVHKDNPNSLYEQGDSLLIKGNNLLTLKALRKHFHRKIRCIYIDPPFNTGKAFEHYDDGIEHTLWLSMMRARLEGLKPLLADDGVIFVHIDNAEVGYLRVLMDEVFKRPNFVQMISVKRSSPAGFKTVNPGPLTVTDYILMYARNKPAFIKRWKPLYVPVGYDSNYDLVIENFDDPPALWTFKKIEDIILEQQGFANWREAKKDWGSEWQAVRKSLAGAFALENAKRIVSVRDPHKPSESLKTTLAESKCNKGKLFVIEREGNNGYVLNGGLLSFYRNKVKDVDGTMTPTEILSDMWTDINFSGHAKEGGVQFKNGKKPEMLLRRLIEMATDPGDWVLDNFLGSGTTAAVAHKMGRRWIGVEIGEQAETHALPRLSRVVSGEDQTGISKKVEWKGGEGFRYYTLGESLFIRDADTGLDAINPNYRNGLLVAAICNMEEFNLYGDDILHGIRGNTYAHITEMKVTQGYLDSLADKLTEGKSLVVYCTKKSADLQILPEVQIKRIPMELQIPNHNPDFVKEDFIEVPEDDALNGFEDDVTSDAVVNDDL